MHSADLVAQFQFAECLKGVNNASFFITGSCATVSYNRIARFLPLRRFEFRDSGIDGFSRGNKRDNAELTHAWMWSPRRAGFLHRTQARGQKWRLKFVFRRRLDVLKSNNSVAK